MSSTNTTDLIQPRDSSSRRWRDYALLGGLLAFVIVGLFGLAAATGWEETLSQVSKLSILQVFALLALSLVNYLLRGLRWHIFVNRLGLNSTVLRDFAHYLGGFAMTVTPGRVGEFVRMRWLGRETGASFERTAPLALVDRASDLAAMGALLAICLAISASGFGGAIPVTILALAAAFIITRPKLLRLVGDTGFRFVGRWPRFFVRIRSAARSLGQFSGPAMMAVATGLGILGWFAEGYAFYLLLGWMGSDIGLSTAVAVFVFSTMAGGLTGAPGGVGGAEAAMVALLSIEGVPLEVSLPATAIIRLTTLWFAIAIGVIVFPIAERNSKKVQDALEEI